MHKMCAYVATILLGAAIPLGATGSAHAGDDDETIRHGVCSNGADWKIKAKPDDNRIEVEPEIDTNRVGQTWTWVLRHNGSLSARGRSRTLGPSGSFSLERKLVDAPGVDRFRFRATYKGATCVAKVSL